MAWGNQGKGAWKKGGKGKGGSGKGGAPAKKDWAKKIPWNDRLGKYYLRPYVDQSGSPFVTGAFEEKDLLSSWQLGQVLSEGCSEYCARQGVALSEGAANLLVGAEILRHHFSNDMAGGLKKLGIQDMLALFEESEGKKFLEACDYLNAANAEAERSEEGTTQATKRYVRFMTQDAAKKEALFRKLARFGARLYLFGMEGLEAITAFQHPKSMAAGVGAIGAEYNLPSDCKQWLKNPEDQNLLLWSLVAAYQQQKVDGSRKKRSAGSFDWDDAEEEAAPPTKNKGKGKAGGLDDDSDDGQQGKGKKDHGREAKRARKTADALASDEEKPGGPDLDLNLDSSGEEEIDLQANAWKEWPAEKRAELKALLDEIQTKEPKERPGFTDLLAALAPVPEAGLEAAGLKKTVEDLRKKTRYPKAANLTKLTEALQKMVSQAEAAQIAPPEWLRQADARSVHMYSLLCLTTGIVHLYTSSVRYCTAWSASGPKVENKQAIFNAFSAVSYLMSHLLSRQATKRETKNASCCQ